MGRSSDVKKVELRGQRVVGREVCSEGIWVGAGDG
jgi:hypothetical protein